MKFKYLGPNMKVKSKDGTFSEVPANCYGGARLKTGESVDLNEFLSSKAMKNPNYEPAKPGPKKKKVVKEPWIHKI